MMNPDILPEDAWKKHNEYFNAADGKTFHTALISRNQIYIQLFPECTVWLKVIGSKLHGHDLLMGFDLFFKAQRLQVHPYGLKYKREFKPFCTTQKLFSLTDASEEFGDIVSDLKRS